MKAPAQHIVAAEGSVAGPIETAEDWLVSECERVLGSVFRSIEAGPGEWSDAYLARLISEMPALRVAFIGGEARNNSFLDLESAWMIYIATGWSGQSEKDRRRGRSGAIGSYRAASLLAPWLQGTVIPDVGGVSVVAITNLWNGMLDRKGLSLLSIRLSIPINLDTQIDCEAFDQFLTAGIDWSLPEIQEEE